MDDLTLYMGVAILCGLIGAAIGSPKQRSAFGFFLGLVLGPVGCIIIAVIPGERSRDSIDDLLARPARDPVAAPRAVDSTAAILDLKKLLDAGAITQAEFEAKKRILLDQIGRPTAAPAPSAVRYRIPGIND